MELKTQIPNIDNHCGFTLLELIVTTGTIATLLAIAITAYGEFRLRANVAVTATEIRVISTAFYAYMVEEGEFPEDSHRDLPDGMEDYLSEAIWDEETPMGGYYNWEGPDNYGYAGIAIFSPREPAEAFERLDGILDNGNLDTGRFRTTSNGRFTYIIEEEG